MASISLVSYCLNEDVASADRRGIYAFAVGYQLYLCSGHEALDAVL